MEGLYLEVNGEQVPFVNVSDMTLGELTLLKQTAGMLPLEVEQARWVGDPDAWRGLILIAVRRVHGDAVAEDLDDVNLLAAIQAILDEMNRQRAAAEEEKKKSPPAEPPDGGAEDEPETGREN